MYVYALPTPAEPALATSWALANIGEEKKFRFFFKKKFTFFSRFRAVFATKTFSRWAGSPILFVTTIPNLVVNRNIRKKVFFTFTVTYTPFFLWIFFLGFSKHGHRFFLFLQKEKNYKKKITRKFFTKKYFLQKNIFTRSSFFKKKQKNLFSKNKFHASSPLPRELATISECPGGLQEPAPPAWATYWLAGSLVSEELN
jgi:hypothetical protein